jgi:hypothetical protein
VTPLIFGSLKASTQTLWLAPNSFQAVVTQPTVSARATVEANSNRVIFNNFFTVDFRQVLGGFNSFAEVVIAQGAFYAP